MSASHDHIMLIMRLARQVMASADATEEQWIELAGLLNVCGLFAQEQNRQDWLASLMAGGNAMRSVEDRHRRVGGRYVSNEAETEAITQTLNVIDAEIMKAMPLVDFVRLSQKVNDMVDEYRAKEQEQAA